MPAIKFETGIKTYTLNDTCEISFNPTDSTFIERLFNLFNDMDKKQEAYREEVEKTADRAEIFRIARERDAEMRSMLDNLLGAGVCEAVFGGVNVYALADGLPLWANLLLAVIDELDTSFAREQKMTNPRIAKYTAKYHK